ncbi:MAG: response regulator [Thermodesulfobacteriota bacterium]
MEYSHALIPEEKVLLVEDNEMRNLYAKHISNKGFEVKTASDGEDALQKLTEFMSKVIISKRFIGISA